MKKWQPALVGKTQFPEESAPERVGRHHRVGLSFLRRSKRLKVFDYRILKAAGVSTLWAPWMATTQRAPPESRHAQHVERVQGPLSEALQKQQEAGRIAATPSIVRRTSALTTG